MSEIVQNWLLSVLDENSIPQNSADLSFLLCHTINVLFPLMISKIEVNKPDHNLKQFLIACNKLGIKQELFFQSNNEISFSRIKKISTIIEKLIKIFLTDLEEFRLIIELNPYQRLTNTQNYSAPLNWNTNENQLNELQNVSKNKNKGSDFPFEDKHLKFWKDLQNQLGNNSHNNKEPKNNTLTNHYDGNNNNNNLQNRNKNENTITNRKEQEQEQEQYKGLKNNFIQPTKKETTFRSNSLIKEQEKKVICYYSTGNSKFNLLFLDPEGNSHQSTILLNFSCIQMKVVNQFEKLFLYENSNISFLEHNKLIVKLELNMENLNVGINNSEGFKDQNQEEQNKRSRETTKNNEQNKQPYTHKRKPPPIPSKTNIRKQNNNSVSNNEKKKQNKIYLFYFPDQLTVSLFMKTFKMFKYFSAPNLIHNIQFGTILSSSNEQEALIQRYLVQHEAKFHCLLLINKGLQKLIPDLNQNDQTLQCQLKITNFGIKIKPMLNNDNKNENYMEEEKKNESLIFYWGNEIINIFKKQKSIILKFERPLKVIQIEVELEDHNQSNLIYKCIHRFNEIYWEKANRDNPIYEYITSWYNLEQVPTSIFWDKRLIFKKVGISNFAFTGDPIIIQQQPLNHFHIFHPLINKKSSKKNFLIQNQFKKKIYNYISEKKKMRFNLKILISDNKNNQSILFKPAKIILNKEYFEIF